MVSASGGRRHDQAHPIPITTQETLGDLPVIQIAGMDELLDVLERIQQQLGLGSGINLEYGERVE